MTKKQFKAYIVNNFPSWWGILSPGSDYKILRIFNKNESILHDDPTFQINEKLKLLNFGTDIIYILQNKNIHSDYSFILVANYFSAISLRNIGEIRAQALIGKPYKSFIVGAKACSNDLNILLLADPINDRLLNYEGSKIIDIYSISWESTEAENPILKRIF